MTWERLRGPRAIRARGPRRRRLRVASHSRRSRGKAGGDTIEYWVAAVPGDLARRAEPARRGQGRGPRPEEDDVPDGRLPAVHEGLGEADPERGGRPRHPGPAAARRGRRHRPRPLPEPRHAQQPAALDALPRRPLPAGLRRRLPARLLGPGRERRCRASRSPTGSTRRPDSVGVWPYHDHSPSMDDSIAGGLYGAISILEPGRRRSPTTSSSSSSRRRSTSRRSTAARSSATRRSSTRRSATSCSGTCSSLGDDYHTFHVHGHRWKDPAGTDIDTLTVGPAESFKIQLARGGPGHVVLPLPRRGPHDAGDDRHLPGVAMKRRAAAPGRRAAGAVAVASGVSAAYGGSSRRRRRARGVDPGAGVRARARSRCCSATRSSGATATARTTPSPRTTTCFDSGLHRARG